jgi:hypothetical protein
MACRKQAVRLGFWRILVSAKQLNLPEVVVVLTLSYWAFLLLISNPQSVGRDFYLLSTGLFGVGQIQHGVNVSMHDSMVCRYSDLWIVSWFCHKWRNQIVL